jgi:Uma2 family endonuclease
MTIALRRALTVDDYLTWAAAHPEARRTELINGQIVSKPPEQLQHTRMKGAVFRVLQRTVAESGLEAEVFTDGVTIPIDTHTAYEPDASVRLG